MNHDDEILVRVMMSDLYGDDEPIHGVHAYVALATEEDDEVIYEQDVDDDYSGDLIAVIRRAGQWGFLQTGYGSCSGCDAIQDALYGGIDQLRTVRDEVRAKVHWEPSKADLVAYIEARTPENDWWLDSERGEAARSALLAELANH